MDNWLDLLVDAKAIRSVYGGSELPNLDAVVLHEVGAHRHGGELTVRLDFGNFPIEPPLKWRKKRADTVQVELGLVPVTALSIDGVISEASVSIVLSRISGTIKLRLEGESINVLGEGSFLYMKTMVAYAARQQIHESIDD